MGWYTLILFFTCYHNLSFADGFHFSTGTHFTSGKYGGQTSTDIWYVPFSARYQYGRASMRMVVPYINITRSERVSNTNPVRTQRKTRSGLGDITLALTYNLFRHNASRTAFDITGRIKFPTASASRRLGTGKFDYAVQGNLIKSIANFNLNATFGYRMPGDPSGVNFRNTFYGGAGIGYRFSPKTLLGTRFNISQSAINLQDINLQDSRTLLAYYSYRINKNFGINIYGLAGLSNRSPDWGSGISLQYTHAN